MNKRTKKIDKGINTMHNPFVIYKNKTAGITLIALVITIIVLLILAGISIITVTGENGILGKATTATINTAHATVKEQIIIGANHFRIEKTADRI